MTVLLQERNVNLESIKDSNVIYKKIDINNEEEVVEFEKTLYKEFMERNPDSWVSKNYIRIDDCRFRIPMNYKDLGIYVAKNNNKIIMGIALNFNMKTTLLLEKKGFKNINKDDETAEGLLFFSVQSELYGLNFFEIVEHLLIMAKENFIKEKIIKKIFAVCTKEFLNMYQLMNFKPIKKIKIDGKEKYLLCCFI